MIPILRIYFDKQEAKEKIRYGSGDFSPSSAVRFAIDKLASKSKKPLYADDIIRIAGRYADDVSHNKLQTMKAFSNSGYGRYRKISTCGMGWYGFEISEIDLTPNKNSPYCDIRSMKEINPIKDDAEICKRLLYIAYYMRIKEKVKTLNFINFCAKCGKCHKVSSMNATNCRSCNGKESWYARLYNDAAEVSRLVNKLKKAVNHENKRLKKEASKCN